MTRLRSATGRQDLELIHRLAHRIWGPTYKDYLDPLQIETMLADMYSVEALGRQLASGITFTIWEMDGLPAGFVGFGKRPFLMSENEPTPVMRIEKLYILPAAQGFGGGRLLVQHVEATALSQGIITIELNVNRHNPAHLFYRRQGFIIVQEVDIPYGNFLLNDYIMQKEL